MPEPFSVGDAVIWQTPEDRKHWRSEYERLTRYFGPGPFKVVKLHPAPSIPHPQLLELRGKKGRLRARGKLYLVSGAWVKKA